MWNIPAGTKQLVRRFTAYSPGANRRLLEETKLLAARALLMEQPRADSVECLADVEFKVFSQFGDDGIIQYLARTIRDLPQTFIEFGVENYREANTRFLLVNDNWSGLVIDGSPSNVKQIVRDPIYWQHDLTAVSAFITTGDINGLFLAQGFAGPIGLLSLDIDGNDYWVWEAVDAVDPVVVVCEYNAVFGGEATVSIPYDPEFQRTAAHYSNLYFGASLSALVHLANTKGYAFVGCNSSGNNAYFVKRDRLGSIRELTVEQGFVMSRFRESRDPHGRLTYLAGAKRLEAIADLPVVDVTTGVTHPLSALMEPQPR